MLMNRRDALFGFSLTLVAGAGGYAWAQPALGWTPTALTPAQAQVLDAVAELVYPKTDTPGAREAGVPEMVDRALNGWCDPTQAGAIKSALTRMDSDAKAAHGTAFVALTPTQQAALLARYDQEVAAARGKPTPFGGLKDLITIGYFTSKPGATVTLRYDPVPGDYRGCVPMKEIGRAWAT
jgi:gluconate 2-dehydrogenase gamma chain